MHTKLVHVLTEYDRKQSSKKHYNMYALPQYFNAAKKVQILHEKGNDLRLCFLNCFCGRLLDFVLKKFNLETSTKAEQMGDYQRLPEPEIHEENDYN